MLKLNIVNLPHATKAADSEFSTLLAEINSFAGRRKRMRKLGRGRAPFVEFSKFTPMSSKHYRFDCA